MEREATVRRLGRWYARLLRCYPASFRARFAVPMRQTFEDLLRERANDGRRLSGFVAWVVCETSVGIVRERAASAFARQRIRRLGYWAAGIATLLLIPLTAMQFSAEVAWTAFDFAFAAGVLFAAAVVFETLSGLHAVTSYRLGAGVAVATGVLLVWAAGAVGVIGTERDPINLAFPIVIAVGIIVACIARFRPRGMAAAACCMAAAQTLVAVAALSMREPSDGFAEVAAVTLFFVVLWLAAASLFGRAARVERRALAADRS